MSHLIRNGQLVDSDTTELQSLEAFLAAPAESASILIQADEEIEVLAEHLGSINVIALDFPAFSDGRAYSSANLLRRQFDFAGEIRAVGDVRIDQLEQMVRCGFNAFQLADGQNSNLALTKLDGFTHSYQQTIDREPLFRAR